MPARRGCRGPTVAAVALNLLVPFLPVTDAALSGRVVRVLPDVAPVNREFDYVVPAELDAQVRVGTRVRINLHGRRVGGWVVDVDVTPPPGVALRPISKVTGWGPSPDLISLAGWAAWRWAGPRVALLESASPDFSIRTLPPPHRWPPQSAPASASAHDHPSAGASAIPAAAASAGAAPVAPPAASVGRGDAAPVSPSSAGADDDDDGLLTDALALGRAIVRLPPAADLLAVVLAAAALGPTVVVSPALATAESLAHRLRDVAVPNAVVPREWGQAAAGTAVVLGARGAAWAPCPELASVVVLDGHEEALQQKQSPNWNAWIVAAERARRAGVPCIVVSSCPTVEMLAWFGARVLVPSRGRERIGWAALEIVDRHRDDPRTGLYSPRLVELVRSGRRVVCVLNTKGRARLLACGTCNELVRCERCGATVSLDEERLTCRRCQTVRPAICLACGSMRLKVLRVGVTRAIEDLERLAGQPIGEVTSDTGALPDTPIVVGTEAVLRRIASTDAVAFLDFDQELLAPRYRAAEEALALLALASRLVGGRTRSGRVMVQTRVPQHEVLVAALTADPARVTAKEAARRRDLALPPATAVALVSGAGAEEYVPLLGGVEVLGPDKGRWLVKAANHDRLSVALAAVPRPAGRRMRLEVDPLRL